jgi:hypothetical protein
MFLVLALKLRSIKWESRRRPCITMLRTRLSDRHRIDTQSPAIWLQRFNQPVQHMLMLVFNLNRDPAGQKLERAWTGRD